MINKKNHFLSLALEQKKLILLGLVFLALSSGALLIYPYYIKQIIDNAIAAKNQELLNFAAKMSLLLFLIQSLSAGARYYCFTVAGEKIVRNLRLRLFNHIIHLNISFFDQHKTGELTSRLQSDTATLQNALSVNISMLVRSFIQCLGGLIMLFYTSFELTVYLFLLVPVVVVLTVQFGKKIKTISKRTQDLLAHTGQIAQEAISGVKTVKSFTSENFEKNRYNLKLDESFEASKSKIREIGKFTVLVSTLGLFCIVFIVWFGGTLAISGKLSVGSLTSYLLYLMTVAFSVGLLSSLWSDFMAAVGASSRLFEILELQVEAINNEVNPHYPPLEGKIEFKKVSFAYPARDNVFVLNRLSLSIDPNQTVAIVGPSGSGKSTLALLLYRFYLLNSGEILIDNKNIENFELLELRNQIGIVSQEPVLVTDTIFENIKYGNKNASTEEVKEAARLAFALDFINSFPKGFETLVGEKGQQLSGGQKQRIAIARALLKNPRILILDEATSSLDTESEALVQRALDKLMGKRTTIIMAHRLSTIKNADKIIVLSKGSIVEEGTHETLYANQDSLYHKLVKGQFFENS